MERPVSPTYILKICAEKSQRNVLNNESFDLAIIYINDNNFSASDRRHMNVTLNFENRARLIVLQGTKIPPSLYVLRRSNCKIRNCFLSKP